VVTPLANRLVLFELVLVLASATSEQLDPKQQHDPLVPTMLPSLATMSLTRMLLRISQELWLAVQHQPKNPVQRAEP
jgi:hypothetical protein